MQGGVLKVISGHRALHKVQVFSGFDRFLLCILTISSDSWTLSGHSVLLISVPSDGDSSFILDFGILCPLIFLSLDKCFSSLTTSREFWFLIFLLFPLHSDFVSSLLLD